MIEVIYLISRARPSGPINQALNILTGMKKKGDVHAVLVTLAPEEDNNSWLQRFYDNGIDVVQFMQPLKNTWHCIKMLQEYVESNHVQVIHSAGYRADFVSLMTRCNAKKVSTQRCLPNQIAEKLPKVCRPFLEKAHLKMIKKMDAVVGCSLSLQQIFKSDYCMVIDAVQNGVNTDLFKPATNSERAQLRKQYGIDPDEVVYLMIGSLRKRKNVSLIIEAFRKWDNNKVKLFIVGKGPDEKMLRAQAEHDKRICFMGYTSKPLEFYNLSDVIVSCSLAEGLPNTILEGMACGLPSILSDIEPHKELINDDRLGVLFRNNDDNTLLEQLRGSETWDINNMHKYVREIAVQEHSVYKLANDYENVYLRVLNDK